MSAYWTPRSMGPEQGICWAGQGRAFAAVGGLLTGLLTLCGEGGPVGWRPWSGVERSQQVTGRHRQQRHTRPCCGGLATLTRPKLAEHPTKSKTCSRPGPSRERHHTVKRNTRPQPSNYTRTCNKLPPIYRYTAEVM